MMVVRRMIVAGLGAALLLGGCHGNKAADNAADEIVNAHDNAAEALDNRADALENQAGNLHDEAKDLRGWGKDKAHAVRKAGKDGVTPDEATMNQM